MCVSVLMSVYYKENPIFLNEAMESIWDKQSLRPIQIVLVEDGVLTKELYIVLDNWSSKLGDVLLRIPLSVNGGLTKALNIGIEKCTGEYIARMDSDDISTTLRFKKQVDFLKFNKEIDVVGGAIQEFNSLNDNLMVRKYPLTNDLLKKYIVKASPFAHPTVMMRKKIFDNGIRYPEQYITSQDIALWYFLMNLGHKMANLPEIICHFRIADDFLTRRSKAKAINEFKIYWYGINELYGFTWKLVFPFLRLGFRFSPNFIIKRMYSSDIRKKLNPRI